MASNEHLNSALGCIESNSTRVAVVTLWSLKKRAGTEPSNKSIFQTIRKFKMTIISISEK